MINIIKLQNIELRLYTARLTLIVNHMKLKLLESIILGRNFQLLRQYTSNKEVTSTICGQRVLRHLSLGADSLVWLLKANKDRKSSKSNIRKYAISPLLRRAAEELYNSQKCPHVTRKAMKKTFLHKNPHNQTIRMKS